MEIIDFSRLFSRASGHSFPVLIKLEHPVKKPIWYFTSNNVDIQYNGLWYTSVPMSYKFPSSTDGVPQGGTLEIDIDQQKYIESGDYYTELLKWFDEIDDKAFIEVIGLINEQGDIVSLSHLKQSNGSITWDGEKITWSPSADVRLNMQINPWVLDNDALTG